MDRVFDLNARIYDYLFCAANNEMGSRLVKLATPPESVAAFVERCEVKYPKASSIFHARSDDRVGAVAETLDVLSGPSQMLGYEVDAVVWHISDLHFGKLNKVQPDPRRLAYTMATLATEFRSAMPDVVIVSGDISSKAAPAEFDDFKVFCQIFSREVWQGTFPERILVVPGNHDVTWESNGTADRMAAFQSHFHTDDVCISPFGTSARTFADNTVVVERFDPAPATVPPFAVVRYKKKALAFVLLVSGYFSGNIPENLRTITRTAGTEEELLECLRLDEGGVNEEYIYNIIKYLNVVGETAIAVIHHNPIQYGVQTCSNKCAPHLMQALDHAGVSILLHGHVHLTESRENKRPPQRRRIFPVPAPTLCSIPTAGATGLNIHYIGPPASARNMDSAILRFSESGNFAPEDASLRYRFVIGGGYLEVTHL